MQFFGYIYVLRTVRYALITSDAMTGLTEFRYTAVISYKKCPAGFDIILILSVFRNIAFIDTTVIM